MIEHVSVPVSDYKKSEAFYKKALAPLGYELFRDFSPMAGGFAEGESTSFWIVKKNDKVQPLHVAVSAPSRSAVQEFYDEGLKNGGTDNGAPGFRTEYGDNYYAAFLLDPDGSNIEACFFGDKASEVGA